MQHTPDNLRQQGRWLEPFIQNRQVPFELCAGGRDALKFCADSMALSTQAAHHKVNNKDISVTLETSPARRTAVKAWYTASDSIHAANKNCLFAMCNGPTRSLAPPELQARLCSEAR